VSDPAEPDLSALRVDEPASVSTGRGGGEDDVPADDPSDTGPAD
jgi:hypothetical protein